ncbi:MAG: T9SS type A sorting domain-containing protein [Bacteroidota bacterium]
MRIASLIILLGLAPVALAQPTFVNAVTGSEEIAVEGVAADAAGNVYITGHFEGTVDLDPSDGPDAEDSFTAIGLRQPNAFVASYTSAGAYRWGYGFGGTTSDIGNSIATDGTRVYVVGGFRSSAGMDVEPGAGETVLTPEGGNDAFVVAYAASTGALEWAFNLGGVGADNVFDVATDGDRVYLGGVFEDPMDIDPGAGTTTLDGFTDQVNAFMAAYAADDGTFVWGHDFFGPAITQSLGIGTDGDGAYVTGSLRGTADFDPSGGTAELTGSTETGGATATEDVFVAAYDASSGAYRWAHLISGPNGQRGFTIDADGDQVYVGGGLAGSADFDPGAGTATLESSGVIKPFIAAYTASAGAYVWANLLDSTERGSERTYGIAAIGNRVYATGAIQGTIDFDPGPGTVELTTAGFLDAFLVAYNTADGALEEAGLISGTANERAYAVAVSSTHVIVGGDFSAISRSPVDFDTGAGMETRVSTGSFDGFLASYPVPEGVDAESSPARLASLSVYPNPGTRATVELAVEAPASVSLTLYDALGRQLEVLFEGEVVDAVQTQLPVGLAPGVYVVRASSEGLAESVRVTVLR